jgi:hypothetical protein
LCHRFNFLDLKIAAFSKWQAYFDYAQDKWQAQYFMLARMNLSAARIWQEVIRKMCADC